MPDLLVSVADFRTFMDDPGLDAARAEQWLRLAGGEVRGYTGNLFDWIEGDTIRLNGTGTTVLLLPEAPVAAVYDLIEAKPTTTPVELSGVDEGGSVWEWDEDGVLERVDGGIFARRRRWYEVTYDHGFANVPDDVQGVVMRLAAQGLENPEGALQQETLGKYSYTTAGASAGLGLYPADRATLDRYFISTKMREGTAPTGSGGS